MPIFDYKCKCGHVWNDHMVARGKDEVLCPKCNEPMERQFNLSPCIILDHLTLSYMPPPKHLVDNPQEYYR